jgi:uncharacterized membrane protein
MPFAWRFWTGPWWLFVLFAVVVLVLLVLGLVLMARERRNAQPPTTWTPTASAGSAWGRPTPEEILRERLARSEISVDEYQRIMVALTTDPSRAMPPETPTNPGPPTTSSSAVGSNPPVPPAPPDEPHQA